MIKIFKKENIDKATKEEYRQYLVGHLEKSQILNHIEDDVEIGISDYSKFTADKGHYHPVCSEYNFILKGTTKVLLLDTNEEFVFDEGDFFYLSPNTPYLSKHKSGTKILFIKSPSVNDKTLVEETEEIKKWLSSW